MHYKKESSIHNRLSVISEIAYQKACDSSSISLTDPIIKEHIDYLKSNIKNTNFTFISIKEDVVDFNNFNNLKKMLLKEGYVYFRLNIEALGLDDKELFSFGNISQKIISKQYGKKNNYTVFIKRNKKALNYRTMSSEMIDSEILKNQSNVSKTTVFVDSLPSLDSFIVVAAYEKLFMLENLINNQNIKMMLDFLYNDIPCNINGFYVDPLELQFIIEKYFYNLNKKRHSICSIREKDFDKDTLDKLYSNIKSLGHKIYRFKEEKSNLNSTYFNDFKVLSSKTESIEEHNYGVLNIFDIEHLTADKKIEIIKDFALGDQKLENILIEKKNSFKMKGHFHFNSRTRKEFLTFLNTL